MFSMPPSAVTFISETLTDMAPRARALECAVVEMLVAKKYIERPTYRDIVTGDWVSQGPPTEPVEVDFFRDTISGACIASAVNAIQNRVEDALLSYGFITERSEPLVAAREPPQPQKRCLLVLPETVQKWNTDLADRIGETKHLLQTMGIEYEEQTLTVPASKSRYAKFARTEKTCEFPFVLVESIPPAVYGTKHQHEVHHLPLRLLRKCNSYRILPVEIQAKWEDSYVNFFSGVPKTRTFEFKPIEGYTGPKFNEAMIKRLHMLASS